MKHFTSTHFCKVLFNRHNNCLIENSYFQNFVKSLSTASSETAHNDNVFCTKEIPRQAKVIICGGGAVGCSIAYHLARDFGWKDVVLLEQSWFGGGTSRLGAGLLGQIKPTSIETQLCQYSINLYKTLAEEGLNTGFKQCGSLSLARSSDRMIYFRHIAASAVARNVECYILTPEAVKEKCSLINTDMLKGALWIPGDAVGDPFSTILTLASEAARLGVTVMT